MDQGLSTKGADRDLSHMRQTKEISLSILQKKCKCEHMYNCTMYIHSINYIKFECINEGLRGEGRVNIKFLYLLKICIYATFFTGFLNLTHLK